MLAERVLCQPGGAAPQRRAPPRLPGPSRECEISLAPPRKIVEFKCPAPVFRNRPIPAPKVRGRVETGEEEPENCGTRAEEEVGGYLDKITKKLSFMVKFRTLRKKPVLNSKFIKISVLVVSSKK